MKLFHRRWVHYSKSEPLIVTWFKDGVTHKEVRTFPTAKEAHSAYLGFIHDKTEKFLAGTVVVDLSGPMTFKPPKRTFPDHW